MSLDCAEKIAEAVLYEGHILYPYRASSVKNRQRWNFGVLCPRGYCEEQSGSEAWMMQTECLLEAGPSTRFSLEVRFLQILTRTVGKLAHPIDALPSEGEPEWNPVEQLVVDGRAYSPWQEAIERKVTIAGIHPGNAMRVRHSAFEFPLQREIEPIRACEGAIEGIVVRDWETVRGAIEIDINACGEGLQKITLRLRNLVEREFSQASERSDALMFSLVSAHMILSADDGSFISLLDPPENLRKLAAQCVNVGTWPVLVGADGEHDTMLSSPIILYDYPQIAPESPGSLFDGTEIDEILSLRILTLTDQEKEEMRQSDERSREILERTESMPPEQFMKLHGVLRGIHPVGEEAQ
ncbi:MAG TPA: hypothetical protein VMU48_13250 [Terracidiphilus sp.]|nr:hypothetical protein [Terracidiphilus sp.]